MKNQLGKVRGIRTNCIDIGTVAAQKFVTFMMFFVLSSILLASAQGIRSVGGVVSTRKDMPSPSNGSPRAADDQQKLYEQCVEAANRVERQAAAMVPGRTWTWALDAEQSRKRLGGFRRDLKAFWDAEAAFEASFSPDQKSKLNSQFTSIHELFRHIDRDAQSLDDELRKGYPRRWHVAHDVSDMRKEINRWRKLHQQIAAEVGVTQ
jgi:hypothetical protein